MKKTKPLVSVVMPAYNAKKYISESIESILSQTRKDFELLIINDGSTDNTLSFIKKFKDPRIKLIQHKKNKGLIYSLNHGLKYAKGEYIVRMDADDISSKDRLQVQLDFMKRHKGIGVCGSWAETFGEKRGLWKTPIKNIDIKTMLIFDSPLIHPSVMMKKSIIKEYPNYKRAEDYGLWVGLMNKTRFHNIPKCLIKYRIHGLNKQQKQDKDRSVLSIRKIALEKAGIKLNKKELLIFNNFANWKRVKTEKQLDDVYKIIIKILKHSRKKHISNKALIKIMANRWYALVTKSHLNSVSVHVKYPKMFLYMVLVKCNLI